MSEQTGTAESKEPTGEIQNQTQGDNRGGEQQQRRGGRNRNRNRQRGGGGGGGAHHGEASLNMTELREIAELFGEYGLTDFEFENENIRVRLRKELAPQIVQAAPQTFATAPAPTPAAVAAPTTEVGTNNAPVAPAAQAADADANLKKIISPIVGTFYRSPSPEADPFVEVGSQISDNTIVCIVEAMKLMNEIPAEISGEIVKIYVENGQPVEYGQPLFAVK